MKIKKLIFPVAFTALTLVGCEPREGNIETTYTLGPTAVAIGDSLTNSGRTDLHAELGTQFATKIAAISGSTFGIMTQYAEQYAPDKPTVAVIALGTNDRQIQWNLSDSISSLNHMYDLYPDSCTIGVTITTDSTNPDLNTKAVALNEAATLRADVMVDWDAHDTEPGMTQSDGVHPTPEGYVYRAQLITEATQDCP